MKKTSRNIMVVVMALCMVFILTVCAGGALAAQSGEKTKLVWWVPNWDEEPAKAILEEFHAENEDIEVEMVITTWDTMENKIMVALSTGTAPDLITDLESRVPTYAQQGYLLELDSWYTGDMDRNDFIDSAIDINSYQGKIYGVPFRHDGLGFLYNKGMFEAAGLDPEAPPKSWDEFLDYAEKLTVDTDGDGTVDQYGMGWPFGNQTNAVVRVMGAVFSEGGTILNDDHTAGTMNTPQAAEAMRKLTDTVKTGVAPASVMELDNTSLRELFINEKIAMYIGGLFDVGTIRTSNPNIDLGTALIPGPSVSQPGMSTVDGFTLIVPAGNQNLEATEKLVRVISRPANQGAMTQTFPGRHSALELPKFSDPLVKPFAEMLEHGAKKPIDARFPEIEKSIYQYLQLIILSDMDIDTAMASMNGEIDAILK